MEGMPRFPYILAKVRLQLPGRWKKGLGGQFPQDPDVRAGGHAPARNLASQSPKCCWSPKGGSHVRAGKFCPGRVGRQKKMKGVLNEAVLGQHCAVALVAMVVAVARLILRATNVQTKNGCRVVRFLPVPFANHDKANG